MMEEGARVVLKVDEAEGWPREEGVVKGLIEMHGGTAITVRVDECCRHNQGVREDEVDVYYDDLPEVTLDQLTEA